MLLADVRIKDWTSAFWIVIAIKNKVQVHRDLQQGDHLITKNYNHYNKLNSIRDALI